jgi:Protein of unknown function (DUF2934)
MAKETVKKAVTKRTTSRKKKAATPTYDDIARRAYYIHLEQGGDPFENWIRAERELIAA